MSAADQARPPVNGVAVGRECMEHPYHIRFIRVHFTECLITEMETRQNKTRFEFEWGRVGKGFVNCQLLIVNCELL